MEGTSTYTGSYREYVEAIYELAEEGLDTIQARIADWLGVSRASVSEMVRRMEGDGLVEVGDSITLTAEGRHLAEVVVRRHRLSERFLSEVLGLPWVQVHEEATVWEHMISDEVEAAMWRLLGEAKTCPHGNPIPGAGYRPPPMEALSAVQPGPGHPLERISEELELERSIMGLLDREGIRPGADLEVTGTGEDGRVEVSVERGKPVTLDGYVAERLFVRKSEA